METHRKRPRPRWKRGNKMVKTCGTCNWWDDNGVCANDEVAICQTGETNTCPFWEEWDEEWDEEDT